MESPKEPLNDEQRVRVLRSYRILDTLPERSFDGLVEVAACLTGSPIAVVSLVDATRQWSKASFGAPPSEAPRDITFCGHAILTPHLPTIVNDARLDARFHNNPLVVDEPHIRFYAGMPLVSPSGHALGTLCVIDHEPRDLSPQVVNSLQALARQAVALMELRRVSDTMARALERVHALREMVPICSYCRSVQDDQDDWQALDSYVRSQTGAEFSHGICPTCLLKHHGIQSGPR